MAEPSNAEREAFIWMQGRMVELLMRYDIQRFGDTFSEQIAEQERFEHPVLEQYRRLAVLFYLRDELFDSILPRIKRRLSVAAPREVQIEELPPRGRIDWSRTMAATWTERPGEISLEVHTRQRRRHFATPENLLTVATLLEYRAAVQNLLDEEIARDTMQAVRHPLNEIVDTCTRELVFPQFAGLIAETENILAGYAAQSIDELEQSVAEHLIPGRNSAYDDLLIWRRKLAALRLLDRTTSDEPLAMIGSSPSRDNYLYQMWIFYELAGFLEHKGIAVAWESKPDQRNTRRSALRFSWGADPVEYRVTHDLEIPTFWEDVPALRAGKNSAPHVRPDFYIARAERQQVKDGPTVIWQEPGYMLDAKYYKPYASTQASSDPIKRMIADLNLTGERYGALLFAFLQSAEKPPDLAASPEVASVEMQVAAAEQATLDQPPPVPTSRPTPLYQVNPLATIQPSAPDVQVQLWRAQPQFDVDSLALHGLFESLLAEVHGRLSQPVAIRCHGIFLDQLSANGHGQLALAKGLVQRNGAAIDAPIEELLLCPKPHIAPWRVDLVRLKHDCCQNATVCHIIGQTGAQPPRRLVELQDVTNTIKSARGSSDATDQEIVETATAQVRAVIKRYQQFIQPNLADYLAWIRQRLDIDELFDETPLLDVSTRETLALARFLWEQTEYLRAANFAGPTLLFTGVLETLARQTIFRVTPLLTTTTGKPLMQTLGTLGNSRGYGGQNYLILETHIVTAGHWQPNVAAGQQLPFIKWIDTLRQIVETRNRAAHDAMVSKSDFDSLIRIYFGGTSSGYGLLNGFLLAWKE